LFIEQNRKIILFLKNNDDIMVIKSDNNKNAYKIIYDDNKIIEEII
jgi:hypothetical protein